MKKLNLLSTLIGVCFIACFLLMPDIARAKDNPRAVIDTGRGEIVVELFADEAPISVKNFLDYTKDGFYNGTIFHRVMSNFMIQGGGFTKEMRKKPVKSPIKNEANNGLSNLRGTLAMARTNVVDSATSQFFINVVNNQRLDYKNPLSYGYAVFGRVVEGMGVVDKIKQVATTGKNGHQDVPINPVIIKSIKRTK